MDVFSSGLSVSELARVWFLWPVTILPMAVVLGSVMELIMGYICGLAYLLGCS